MVRTGRDGLVGFVLEGWAADVVMAWRNLRRDIAFTAVALAMLSVGIGANAAVFSVASAVLFKGFRLVDDNDRLLYIGTQREGRGCCASYPDFQDWRAQTTAFTDLGAVADLRVTLTDSNGFAESHTATRVSANVFQLVRQAPILGRDFLPSDEAPGAEPVAILSHGLWERRYGSDASIVGRIVEINGAPTTVIGVMPRGFMFPQNQELWVPLVPTPDLLQRDNRTLWFAVGRLADGGTLETARAELATIGARLARTYPETNDGWAPSPRTFTTFFGGRNAALTYGAMWSAVGLVLLIACANLANLMLARAIGRARETTVRMALGASRWRIARQFLIESVTLSTLGGVLAWWLATWAVRVYEVAANPPTRSWSEQLLDYSADGRVLAYLVALSIGSGLLFGLVPALRLSRTDISAALKDSAGGGWRRRRLSSALVAGTLALSLVLLAGAGVTIRSVHNVYAADIGVDTANVVTMMMSLPERYSDAPAQESLYRRLTTQLETIPGIESVALASSIPAAGARRATYEPAGSPPDAQQSPAIGTLTIGPAYFRTLGAAVISGREFDDFDRESGLRVAIVNRQFASLYWPGQNALGRRIRMRANGTSDEWLTVVGVVSDIVQDATRQAIEPLVYLPYRQQPTRDMWVLVRTALPAGALAVPFREAVAALDRDLPIALGPFTLDERLAGIGNYWNNANLAALLAIFAAIALLIASTGLYAIVAYSIRHQTKEIGIRIAVGATSRDILRLVARHGFVLVAGGLVTGLAGAIALNRLLRAELVAVSPTDPLTLALACAVLAVAATLGCWIPARRAMRLDPVVALKR